MSKSNSGRQLGVRDQWCAGSAASLYLSDEVPTEVGAVEGVPVQILKDAIDATGNRIADCPAFLRGLGIDPRVLDDEDGFVSKEQFGDFWRTAARELGDEFFCQDQRGMPCGSYTLLCYAVLHADTLERAVRRMLRYYHMLLTDFDGRLSVHDGVATITLHEKGPGRTTFAYWTFCTQFMGLACWLVDRRIPLLQASIRATCTRGEEHYRRLFCDDTRFGQAQTSISFDAHYLAMRPHRDETQVKAFLRNSPDTFVVKYRSRDSLSALIAGRLRRIPPAQWPLFEQVAASLNTTPSTLRRRLDQEEVSYQQIKDAVRCERAISHLRANVRSVPDIAEELGFGDPCTFYRAFKKWTGATPNAFRSPSPDRRIESLELTKKSRILAL